MVGYFRKMHWKVQQRFGFVKIEGSLKYAILAVDRGRGHRYLTEIDAFSFRSYRKTRSNLHICFGHIIYHLSTFLNLDTVSKNLQLRSYFGSLNVPQSEWIKIALNLRSFLHTHNSTGIRFIWTKVVSSGRTAFLFYCVKIFFAANE